ncbi:MAG: ABC transporter ATP-binding protein YtrE [Chlamydiia bacterium]|nr:ABC transporter ATP-binding protein YtrE [Chlamydiia bacterium]MCH9618324.1 ABC transporter ATP-binding protein YtrE [Chlamydiia bacterium]MCH9624496.1 ABC transporter ATP-binding protein YtrE [Chlamydiia bacterium]
MGEIEFNDVSYIEKEKIVLKNITLTVSAGELFMIKGSSNVETKAFLRLINGFIAPSSGRLKIDQKDGISIGSNLIPFLPALKAREILSLPLIARGYSKAESDRKIEEIASYFSLSEFLDKKVKELSKDTLALLGVSKAVIAEPSLVLLDTFTPFLEHRVAVQVMTYLHEISVDYEVTVVMVENDKRLHPFAGKILHLEDGYVKELVGEGVDLNKLMPFLKI